jgi:hypothetical protein
MPTVYKPCLRSPSGSIFGIPLYVVGQFENFENHQRCPTINNYVVSTDRIGTFKGIFYVFAKTNPNRFSLQISKKYQ